MPTNYTDQFFLIDASAPPPVGTAVSFTSFSLTDQNDDGDFDRFNNDLINGSDIRQSYPGDTITINVPGVGDVTYVGTTFYLANGQVVFTPSDGQVLMDGTFVSSTFVNTQGPLLVSELGPPCFTPGTLIATPQGATAIERLAVGDLVETLDNGAQPVRWIGARTVAGDGRHAPVRFRAGTIGNHAPLIVSPQHRILWQGADCELHFGLPEVLVPALHLTELPDIDRKPMAEVTYLHLLLDRHEILFANGAATESLHPGGQFLATDRALRAEIAETFPDCPALVAGVQMPPARPVLAGFEARLLVA
ncbi:MAG: Hint domain-containing protein [Paracoccaceae bacterium]